MTLLSGRTLCKYKILRRNTLPLAEADEGFELQEIATTQYFMPWKKNSEVNRRTVWLRDLGLVVFHEHSLLYELTDAGRSFLKTIEVVFPESISEGELSDPLVYELRPGLYLYVS